MTTLITHIYNEEFLLPYWITHHKDKFDQVIVIDFASTDSSTKIIQDLAPHWIVIESPLETFDAEELDKFIMKIEEEISGPRIVLTTTEFLIGDLQAVQARETVIPSIELVALPGEIKFDRNLPFHQQINIGIPYFESTPGRTSPRGRLLHYGHTSYTIGRHYSYREYCPVLIYRVAQCLVTEEMISRRLQIQHRISSADKEKGHGVQHHNFGKGLSRQDVLEVCEKERECASDVSHLLNAVLFYEKFSRYQTENYVQLTENFSEAVDILKSLHQKYDEAVENLMEQKIINFENERSRYSKLRQSLKFKFPLLFELLHKLRKLLNI